LRFDEQRRPSKIHFLAMNPPPLPPPVIGPAPPRKLPLVARVIIILGVLFLCFVAFRVVQTIMYFRKHGIQHAPGEQESFAAEKLIIGDAGGIAYGNSDEAKTLADGLARALKIARQTLFEGGNTNSLDMQLLTKGDFIVFCQLNDDSCAFIVHVPELNTYDDDAKKAIAQLAYTDACKLLDAAQKRNIGKLAIETRGTFLNDTILLGDYTFQNEKPLEHVQRVQDIGIQTPTLYPFFAPKTK
jgi:hypothetical protein